MTSYPGNKEQFYLFLDFSQSQENPLLVKLSFTEISVGIQV